MTSSASGKPPLRIFTLLVSLGERLERSITRYERRYLLFAFVCFALTVAYHACTAPLGFDEFFTLFISRLPSLSAMLPAMPVDSQPPLQYLVTHVSLRVLGQSEFALRLPEELGYLAAGLLAYTIVRRHGTAVQALFAAVLLLGSGIGMFQAYTARPYAMLLGFVALTYSCWQVAARVERGRVFALCGVSAGIAGAVLSQHFGLIHIGMMLGAGEVARLFQRRKVDAWMAVAIGTGFCPLFVTIPMARRSHALLGEAIAHSTNFGPKMPPTVLLSYLTTFAILPACLVAVFALLPWRRSDGASDGGRPIEVPAYEWASVAALCLILPVQVLLAATLERGYYFPRYSISSALGMALLGGWALPRMNRLRPIAQPLFALNVVCSMVLFGAALMLKEVAQPSWHVRPENAVSPLLLNAPGDLPIVSSNSGDYPPQWWYAPPALRARLVYLFDVPYALRQPQFIGELTLVSDRDFIPFPMADFNDFTSSHPHFLLFSIGQPAVNLVPPRLMNAGWRLRAIATSDKGILYQVDRP